MRVWEIQLRLRIASTLTDFREAPVGYHQLEVKAQDCVIREVYQLTTDIIGTPFVNAAAVISC